MSGIVGVVGDVDDIEYRLVAMLDSQKHRGGADRGFWVSSFVESRLGMAHCGKVVSEMEEDVRQPYVDEQTRLIVVMDGDIYNYRELRAQLQLYYTFATDSSVEVVSKAYRHWGEDCLLRMEGVFALVVYDRESDILLLARDRFGVKPLYYTTHRGNLFFASEVRSLFAAGVRRCVSTERWAGYMLYGSYGPVYSTFWDNIYQLPAGSLMRYNGYSLSERCWYSLQDEVIELVSGYSVEELQAMLAEEFRRCVGRSMLDVSSCGLRIVGRIESQLLHRIAIHGQHRWKVHTFTGDIESIGRQPLASPIWVTASHALDELERMQYWVEEPFDGSETVVRTVLFRQARRSGMRVVCSGVGLDALWQDVWDNCEHNYSYFVPHKLFSATMTDRAEHPHYEHYFGDESGDLRRLELENERIPHILRVFDRSAAEAGVYVRMPFLDGRLVALSFALPIASNMCRKAIFEKYVEQYHQCAIERSVSRSLLPMWQSGGVREWVAEMLDNLARSEVREWFDVKQLYRMREAFCNNMPCDVALLWKCIALQRQLGEK
ncbi:MAG: hypothetical protein IKJ79_03435 [Bacteroidaceae bacterium]|nr:hypothetical protein [Bacteroidaceae bacterium]